MELPVVLTAPVLAGGGDIQCDRLFGAWCAGTAALMVVVLAGRIDEPDRVSGVRSTHLEVKPSDPQFFLQRVGDPRIVAACASVGFQRQGGAVRRDRGACARSELRAVVEAPEDGVHGQGQPKTPFSGSQAEDIAKCNRASFAGKFSGIHGEGKVRDFRPGGWLRPAGDRDFDTLPHFRIPGKGESVLTVFPVGVAEADRHFRHARFHLKLEFPQPERPAQFITCGDIFPAVSKIGGELERIRECP